MTATYNPEKNGIELRFEDKPDASTLELLRSSGFHWSSRQKMWYAKRTQAAITVAEKLAGDKSFSDGAESKTERVEKSLPDLWALTRTDSIPDNFAAHRTYDLKEISANIRSHLRERFPMCKWSVRKDRSSLYVEILESPFPMDSDELDAIAEYALKYSGSWNYDNSDPMTDYCDVNFFGPYKQNIVCKWRYDLREATVEEHRMSENFLAAKAKFEKEEEERQEREHKEFEERMAREREEFKKRQAIRDANRQFIEDSAEVTDVNCFTLNCIDPGARKFDSVDEYENIIHGENELIRRTDCQISRQVRFTPEAYALFSHQLLDDYSFLDGKGGTRTDDLRINSDEDYSRMSKEEQETVEWYNFDCVAIFSGTDLKMVIDPEGYGYARYVYFIDGETSVSDTRTPANTGISEAENAENTAAAEKIESASQRVIANAGIAETWRDGDFKTYKHLLTQTIRAIPLRFDIGVVRAVKDKTLKSSLYCVLTECDPLQAQFAAANLQPGDSITVVLFSDFGGLNTLRGTFMKYENTTYAQYNDAVKLIYRPQGKRNLYEFTIYHEVLIYKGDYEIPKSLFWKTVSENDEVKVTKGIFMSFDKAQYDVVIDHIRKTHNALPVINTYKPVF